MSIETRQKLMQIATDLIWDSNYDNVGIADICKQAGVTKGAFYHHFCSKAELFACAYQYDWENMRKDLDEGMSPRYGAMQKFENVLAIVIGKQCRADGEKQICGCPFFTAGAQAGCKEREIYTVSRELCDNGVVYFATLVRNLQDEDCLSYPVDALQTARMMNQFIQGLLMYGRVFQDFEQFSLDLREGLYQILGVQAQLRKAHKSATESTSQTATV